MKVLAIIPVYNEADILPGVLRHLHGQGVDTYVIDNWSTDGILIGRTSDKGPDFMERFPSNHPVHIYQWGRILRRVEEVALSLSHEYQWMMLHDADEIRRAPELWTKGVYSTGGWNLNSAIELADCSDYNVIDFKVYTFPPVDNGWVPGSDPETYFTHYRPDSGYDSVAQEKCWKVYPGVGVDLASTGGHKVEYLVRWPTATKKVCPHKFTLKHYPVRSQSHGERKVFEERRKRWHLGERGRQWHTQYDQVEVGHNFLANREELIEWKVQK